MEEENNHTIGNPELARLYEQLRKKEEELEELKEKKRLLEKIVEYLENHKDEWK